VAAVGGVYVLTGISGIDGLATAMLIACVFGRVGGHWADRSRGDLSPPGSGRGAVRR
jgi:hypothetical protein